LEKGYALPRDKCVIDVEPWSCRGTIAPIKSRMSFPTMLPTIEGVIHTDQTAIGTGGYGIRVVAGFAGLIPTDVIVEITGDDGGASLRRLA